MTTEETRRAENPPTPAEYIVRRKYDMRKADGGVSVPYCKKRPRIVVIR